MTGVVVEIYDRGGGRVVVPRRNTGAGQRPRRVWMFSASDCEGPAPSVGASVTFEVRYHPVPQRVQRVRVIGGAPPESQPQTAMMEGS